MYTPNNDRLIRALRAARDAKLTGALRIVGKDTAGTLFFDGGQVYFGVLDGDRPTTESFERDGISRESLKAASSAPRSNDRFADALMSVGAPGAAVRAFGRRAVTTALARFAKIGDAKFSASDHGHPYGPGFTFDVDELLEAIGVTPGRKSAAVPQQTQEQARPTEAGGSPLKRRGGLRAAALAAQAEHG
ncbi:MAG: hypothetical protein ACFCVC_08340 [Acidimicrobiia bacterium]